MRRHISSSVLVLVAMALWFITGATAEDAPSSQPNVFEGKVVVVYLDRPTITEGQVLKSAELQEVGGRVMIVGQAPRSSGDRDAGIGVGIAWDSVVSYYTMTDEQYKQWLQRRQEAEPRSEGQQQDAPRQSDRRTRRR